MKHFSKAAYLIPVVMNIFLISCGGETGDAGDPWHDDGLLFAMTTNTSYADTVTWSSFFFEGYASTGNSPGNCPINDSGTARSSTGITVTWHNETTGQYGLTDQRVEIGCIWFFGCGCWHIWSARVPLVLGENRIRIHAATTSGYYDDMQFIKSRIQSADISTDS